MMGEEILTERNQLSRQDASCFRSPRSPLGRLKRRGSME
ncbi:Protein CBG03605 [Caenorhabditis briggsae]|uniref:Protein CBG03605 n=1 Tax=Caenorhabditis briggsae TaxID=6238 RepID=A8WVF8_CAEBR|nr:Protein CBG03605 [Caenorhabditis briggsae]CAP24469.2 Protein CBG03605 [Caenorhabditis briggsae]